MTAPAVKFDTDSSPPDAVVPDVSRAYRGRFFAKHNARVIEQDNLVVVEFVDKTPWYTRAIQENAEERRKKAHSARVIALSLIGFSVGSFSLGLAHLFNWI